MYPGGDDNFLFICCWWIIKRSSALRWCDLRIKMISDSKARDQDDFIKKNKKKKKE